jgi:HlyD family secretion protein
MDIERPDLYVKNRRRNRWWIAVSLAAVIVLVVYVVTLSKPLPQVRKDQLWMGEVKRGDMIRNVRGMGKLVPQDLRWLTARTAGRVESRELQSGAAVKPDTVILRLSNPELEQEFLNAQLAFKAAEAEWLSTKVRLQGELLSMRSGLIQLQEQMEMAVLEEQINRELFTDGLVSDLERQRSELSARHLRSRVTMESERLVFQEQAVEPQLATRQTEVDRAKAQMELLSSRMDALVVRAGYHGVIQRLELEQGMQVLEGQEIALVSDPSRLKAVIEVQESQAREVLPGQVALVDTRSSGSAVAKVARVDPNVERGVVKVDLVFPDGLPDGCRPDQTVQGTIELERLPEVLHVDRPATVREYNVQSVFVLREGGQTAQRRPVEFGRTSVSLVEVIKGLEAGERIILSDTSRWDSAEEIQIR